MKERFRPDTRSSGGAARRWLLTLALALSASCSDEARQDPASARLLPSNVPPRTPPFVASESAAGTEVRGRLVDGDSLGLTDRRLVFVDARGTRTEVTTGDDGNFAVRSLVTPYDVMVAPARDGGSDAPVAYLGVSRADLWLKSTHLSRVGTLASSQTVRVGFERPACPTDACWWKIVTHSAHGDGGAAGVYRGTDPSGVVIDVDHGWTVPVLPAGESLEVSFLVGDGGYATFWYGRASVRAAVGEVTDIGTVSLVAVPPTAPLPMTGEATDVPGSWQWNLAAWLDLPGGATMAVQYVDGPALVSRLPRIPGASLRVGVWAQAPRDERRAYFHASSYGWSGPVPLDATSVSVPMRGGPRPLRPTYPDAVASEEAWASSLARASDGFAWERSVGVAALAVASATRGGLLFRAYTDASAVPFARLERLGIARPQAGPHVLDLSTGEGAGLDELLDPDPRVRRRRANRGEAAGASAHVRFLFGVTD